MRITIDDAHLELVQQAVAEGRASDAQGFLQTLIETDAAEQWASGRRAPIEGLLRARLGQDAIERPPGDADALRRRVLSIVERRRGGPAA